MVHCMPDALLAFPHESSSTTGDRRCQIPGSLGGAGVGQATDPGHLTSSLPLEEGGAVDEECSRSHLGMTDPVPGSASARLNNGWVPQGSAHSTARQQGRGSRYLRSR